MVPNYARTYTAVACRIHMYVRAFCTYPTGYPTVAERQQSGKWKLETHSCQDGPAA